MSTPLPPPPLTAFLAPDGRLFPAPTGPAEPGEAPAAAEGRARFVRRMLRAFGRGTGPGLLHLATEEPEADLDPVLDWWRRAARRLLQGACAGPAGASEDLEALAASAPPMVGGEHLSAGLLETMRDALGEALRAAAAEDPRPGRLEALCRGAALRERRLGLQLAENPNDERRPFTFLAVVLEPGAEGGAPRTVPLARRREAGSGDGPAGIPPDLLRPLRRAAESSTVIRSLLADDGLFRPLAWTPTEALRLLREAPALEEAGLVLRVPDAWNGRRPARAQLAVTIGAAPGSRIGLDALLDLTVRPAVDGEPLSAEEWERLRHSADELVRVKGRWVEVDRERLEGLLARWTAVGRRAARGLPFVEAMRLLAGAEGPVGPEEEAGEPADRRERSWTVVRAGPELGRLLERLRRPEAAAEREEAAPRGLRAVLRPYQAVGVRWLRLLADLGLGACLADDMGLGKTVQTLALLLHRRSALPRRPSLLVVPASLLANWLAEADRFAPGLRLALAHPSAPPAQRLLEPDPARLGKLDALLTTYGHLRRLDWLAEREWDLVVLDEAQAIKNPGARQSRAARRLRARARLALTGTPVENRLADLWALFDFLCPGLLGSSDRFGRLVKRLEAARDYGPLRRLVRPYLLRRLKTDRTVVPDLPEKIVMHAWCGLSRQQAALYRQAVDELAERVRGAVGLRRRGIVLASLMRLKQICNHPAHWLGDGDWSAERSGKFERLAEIAGEISARREKALVFTQFREIAEPLAEFLALPFGTPGLVLHGGTPVRLRRRLVERFQQPDGPPFLVASLKTGGTGLNLTAATHVVHFDRWWNPAAEEQATDRAFRIGQRRNVLVHTFVCRGTVEERIDGLLAAKRTLSADILAPGGERLLTELPDDELLRTVALDIRSAVAGD